MFINTQKGFTIIEVIIYLALFAFIIGAGVSTSYYLIDAS
ncbi:prepilin-type N-terminal cleavage/methylation domain-containing protein, partial [Candidatus Parcubacteria bacterium]|nr:prepilin-type N-terminal cleavage/methylation domain-containing protein [Candidatus Parcubacteria bacterium]